MQIKRLDIVSQIFLKFIYRFNVIPIIIPEMVLYKVHHSFKEDHKIQNSTT